MSWVCFVSCSEDESLDVTATIPVIKGFSPSCGLIGSYVSVYGNNFIPTFSPDSSPQINTSIVRFNGVLAEAEYVSQDSTGQQTIMATIPNGATDGQISVSSNGITVNSEEELTIVSPMYIPNVNVTTVTMDYGGEDIAVDNEGNSYISSIDRLEIVKIYPDGSRVSLWSSLPNLENQAPRGIVIDENKNLYATIDHTVRKITPDGNIMTLAGSSDVGDLDGAGSNARFKFPFGIAVDSEGNIYVADLLNYKIRKVTPEGIVNTVAGSTRGFQDGQGQNAQFNSPIDVTIDGDGVLYVTDGDKIRRVTSDGMVSTIAGNHQEECHFLDGSTVDATFVRTRGIIIDPHDNLYLSDQGNHAIRRIAPDGVVATVAGSVPGDQDGLGIDARFGSPKGIAIDTEGALYVAQEVGFIRKIIIN
jgi:sugar lactone lactonase YvrE